MRQSRGEWHVVSARAAGKLKYLTASESGAAVWINDVAPEDAATPLREA